MVQNLLQHIKDKKDKRIKLYELIIIIQNKISVGKLLFTIYSEEISKLIVLLRVRGSQGCAVARVENNQSY